MKLQYLGDVRDAFKWDLLHWICTRSDPPFKRLLFVPLLTRDDNNPRDGRIPHMRYPCRPEIRPLLHKLAGHPRSFDTVQALGQLEKERDFEVRLYHPSRPIGVGTRRTDYWQGIEAEGSSDTLVFLDPDNGFETKTRRGAKWVRHQEIRTILKITPGFGAVVVYQHRPQRRPWSEFLGVLQDQLAYTTYAIAAYEADLAFVILGSRMDTPIRLVGAVCAYAADHSVVKVAQLQGSGIT